MGNESPDSPCVLRLKEMLLLEVLQNVGAPGVEEASEPAPASMTPVLLVQHHFGAMGPHPPPAIFTDEEPPIPLASVDFDHDLIPIDNLLGVYDADKQQVKIFTRAISMCARALRLSEADLQFKVRVHELGHALVHLGTSTVPENWQSFLSQRRKLFAAIDAKAHEVLAQLVACCILKDDAGGRKVFLALMEREPEEYRLSANEQDLSAEDLTKLLQLLRRDFEERPAEFILGQYNAVREAACVLPDLVILRP